MGKTGTGHNVVQRGGEGGAGRAQNRQENGSDDKTSARHKEGEQLRWKTSVEQDKNTNIHWCAYEYIIMRQYHCYNIEIYVLNRNNNIAALVISCKRIEHQGAAQCGHTAKL